MARLVDGFDWAGNPIGPRESWPRSLASAVDICLTSRFPIVLWWGPELRLIYNDAYRPALGRLKHPALGVPGNRVWAEIWHIIGPALERVLATGEASWSVDNLLPMDRYGYLEETYWTYSYSPLADDDGAIRGIFTAVTETTERVIAERRLAALRDLGDAAGRPRDVESAAALIGASLRRGVADLPFFALYVQDDDGPMRLRSSSVPGEELGLPEVVDAAGDGAGVWPLARAAASRRTIRVDRLDQRAAPLPAGSWTTAPHDAFVMPLRASTGDAPLGLLVVGASGGRAVDSEYRSFFDLLADQVASLLAAARALEEERRRAEALAELDRAKTAFFSNVSHEFRTPLTLMLGPVEAVLDDPGLAPDMRRELVTVRRNGIRLLKLVNTLLDFSRAEAGHLDAVYRPTDLAVLTGEIVSGFQGAVEAAGLRLDTRFGDLGGPVWVDAAHWETIVLNLLSNALKFTFDGAIDVWLHRESDMCVLRVKDTGVGIPDAEITRLFDRFHRVQGAQGRSHEGSGIGLALVRQLVEAHGGWVRAESEASGGSTFSVGLPCGADHLDPAALAGGVAPTPATGASPYLVEAHGWIGVDPHQDGDAVELSADGPRPRVLVVDDNRDMRAYVARLLRGRYEVEAVSGGQIALQRILAEPPALVISDVMMPGIDGLELVRRIRADPRIAALPVLLLSARAGEEAAIEGLELGADDYLVKPFSARELVARASAHLELGRGRREGEARFRRLADSTPALIWVLDRLGRCLFLNRSWLDYTGRPVDEQLGEGWTDSIHPEDRPAAREAWRTAIAERRPVELEYRLRRHDGAYRWHLDRGVPIGCFGADEGYAGGVMDIHDRRVQREHNAFLASVTGALDQTLGVEQRLEALTAAIIDGGLADVVAIDLADASGMPVRRAQAVRDPAAEPLVAALGERGLPAWSVMASGEPLLMPHADEAIYLGEESAADDVVRDRLGGVSAIIAPLRTRGRMAGAMTLVRTGGERYDADNLSVVADLARRAGTALDNAILFDEERAMSTMLQTSLLPDGLPRLPGFQLASRYEPGTEGTQAGGDWFDAVPMPDGSLALTVGDVVGRGAAAAAVMGQLRIALRAFLSEGHGPAAALSRLNRLASGITGARATTAVCARIDPARGEVRIACAGHPPPILLRPAGSVVVSEGRGPLLAVFPEAVFQEARVPMGPGDTLVLFSDGLFERRGIPIEVGLGRLLDVASAGAANAARIVERLFGAVEPDGEHSDDVAVLAARIPQAAFHVTGPGLASELGPMRRALREWLAPLPGGDRELDDLVLAAGEAIANAVEHAYASRAPGDVQVRALDEEAGVRITVSDEGRWRDDAPEGAGSRGRGLSLIRTVMDDVSVESGATGTTVTMSRAWAPDPPHDGRPRHPRGPRPDPRLDVAAELDGGGVLRIAVSGDVDRSSHPQLIAAVTPRLEAGRRIVLDLARVTYLGSAGVHALVDLERLAGVRGASLAVSAPDESPAARVIALSGMATVLDGR